MTRHEGLFKKIHWRIFPGDEIHASTHLHMKRRGHLSVPINFLQSRIYADKSVDLIIPKGKYIVWNDRTPLIILIK